MLKQTQVGQKVGDKTYKGFFVIECKALSKDPILEPSKSKAPDSESQGDDAGKENAVQDNESERS